MGKRSMLPLITILILFLIVCIIAIARGNLNTSDKIRITNLNINTQVLEDNEMNELEKMVLTMLIKGEELMGNQKGLEDNKLSIYVKYLTKYLSNANVNLGTVATYEVVDKINDLYSVLNLEKENKFKKMSLDGRDVYVHILEQIYKLCGLKLIHNMDGDIVQISDASGEFNYIITSQQSRFYLKGLVIILVALFILFSLCIMIAKKSQLFEKEKVHDGFNEKEFA